MQSTERHPISIFDIGNAHGMFMSLNIACATEAEYITTVRELLPNGTINVLADRFGIIATSMYSADRLMYITVTYLKPKPPVDPIKEAAFNDIFGAQTIRPGQSAMNQLSTTLERASEDLI